MNLKQKITNAITSKYISNTIKETRECPIYNEYSEVSSNIVSDIFKLGGIPFIEYRSDMVSSEYNNISTIIRSALESISGDTLNINKEYISTISRYNILYNKINKQAFNINREIAKLAGYNCFNINTGFANQTSDSYVGRIGKFITLPFFTSSTRIYDGQISMSVSSVDEVSFSNLDRITSLNFIEKPSVKILSTKDIIEYRITIKLQDTIQSNLIYFKMLNSVQEADLSIIKDGNTISAIKANSNEILYNFIKSDIDSISIKIKTINSNRDKPTSIQIDDIKIFTNIKFTQKGTFESKQNEINIDDFDSISMNVYNTNQSQNININQMVSISSSENYKNYIKTYDDLNIDISSYKFTRTMGFSSLDTDNKTINNNTYKSIPINNTSEYWGMNYINSIIIYGLSDKYLSIDSISKEDRYSNWYEDGNFLATNILNYEDNISINTGDIEVIFNGKSISGIIKIPIGISSIKVHKKDADISRERTKRLTYENDIVGIISGLPVFNQDGSIANKINKQVLVDKRSDIFLGDSFIPFTETISDNNGHIYNLSLSKNPDKPGAYSIEPNIGKINIWPMSNGNLITIEYRKAQQDKRPPGILFNRVLRFKPLSYIISEDDKFHFSVFGNASFHNIILPNIDNRTLRSQILFNNTQDKIFISTKILLESSNIYLTPTISNISLTVK